ncbi:MAG: UTP--glucose-1-phosphate uridylyltransferase [Myxococcaceae bacterium]|nr:UTP--glucose-1-phosphate uridylyltransferase [Myxococcaceae bacterium]
MNKFEISARYFEMHRRGAIGESAERMFDRGIDSEFVTEFGRRIAGVCSGMDGKVRWSEIEQPRPEDLSNFDDLRDDARAEDLAKLVVIKLNGGLGTSMGLSRAKTLLPVKGDDNFLTIIRRQIELLRRRYQAPIPLLFMSSVATQDDTLKTPGIADINASVAGGMPASFLQGWVPRLRKSDFFPVDTANPDDAWCPPGHGDLFLSLKVTGLLDALLDAGIEIAFISNGDNLGASFDGRILRWFIDQGLDFAMEVTPKTEADLKGGVLYRRSKDSDGLGANRLGLLEIAQVEKGREADFQDTSRFAHFNTNNLWLNLRALKAQFSGRGLWLPVIVNPKKVDGIDVVQLETAMGAAIGCFDNTRGLVVPRTRFAPVKTNADLLVRRSDCYVLSEVDGALVKNPRRTLGEPTVRLSDDYKLLGDFDRLFSVIPSLIDLISLEVKGAFEFDVPISLAGKVRLENRGATPVKVSGLGRSTIADEAITIE